MAVTGTLVPLVWLYGEPSEKGGPHGYFSGSVQVAGDASGGNTTIPVDFPLDWLQGKLLLWRFAITQNNNATPSAYNLQMMANYFNATSGSIAAEPSVAGTTASVASLIKPGQAFLTRALRNVTDPTVFMLNADNINGTSVTLFVAGEFWEESRLRDLRMGPLIRW